MEWCDTGGRAGSIRWATSPNGGQNSARPAPDRGGDWSCRLQAADVSVAQRGEDQGEQFPGGGDDADVAAAAGGGPPAPAPPLRGGSPAPCTAPVAGPRPPPP